MKKIFLISILLSSAFLSAKTYYTPFKLAEFCKFVVDNNDSERSLCIVSFEEKSLAVNPDHNTGFPLNFALVFGSRSRIGDLKIVGQFVVHYTNDFGFEKASPFNTAASIRDAEENFGGVSYMRRASITEKNIFFKYCCLNVSQYPEHYNGDKLRLYITYGRSFEEIELKPSSEIKELIYLEKRDGTLNNKLLEHTFLGPFPDNQKTREQLTTVLEQILAWKNEVPTVPDLKMMLKSDEISKNPYLHILIVSELDRRQALSIHELAEMVAKLVSTGDCSIVQHLLTPAVIEVTEQFQIIGKQKKYFDFVGKLEKDIRTGALIQVFDSVDLATRDAIFSYLTENDDLLKNMDSVLMLAYLDGESKNLKNSDGVLGFVEALRKSKEM